MKKMFTQMTTVIMTAIFIMSTMNLMIKPMLAAAYGEEYRVVVDTSQRSFRWPVPDFTGISSCFEDGRNHGAIDITAPKGTPIYAAASGTVTLVRTGCTHNYTEPCSCNNGGGNYVVLEHSIAGNTYWTCYMHCTDILVNSGDWVDAGTKIATIGSTGSSYGFHCDYSIRTGSSWTDRRLDPGYYTQLPSVLRYTGTSPECCLPYLQDIANNEGVILEPRIPGKPTVHVAANDSGQPVIFSWDACANTNWYDVRIYKSDDTNIVSEMGIQALSYSYSLSAGRYYANVASVNENGNYTFSDNVSFTVSNPPKYPDKPVVTVEATSENHPVKVSYKVCANATDYCIRYYDASDKLLYAIGDSEDSKLFGNGSNYTETSHSYTFPVGTYKVTVAAINENDSVWTFSDPVSFTVSASLKGDINTDGEIDRADVDLLMNWLLAVPKTTLKDAEAADMNGDGKLNAVDLTMLKRQVLIKQDIIITLNKSALTLNTEGKSKSYQLTCSYPVAEDVVWKSSNVAVATVKNGLVTAQKDGTVTITATANGVSVSCKVTVKTAYTDTWSDWSDWTATPITASDSVEVRTEDRSNQVLVSYNIDYRCTRRNDNKKRQYRNRSVNLSDYPELDKGYGENSTQAAFGVPYLVKTVEEMNAVARIQPGEWSTGSMAGQNCADVVGYSFDGCIFYILSENYDTVSTTYYSSRNLMKTPVVYNND